MTELDPAVVLTSDRALWDLLDTLPNSARFSAQHDRIVHQLRFDVEAAFRSSIGAEAFGKWSAYMAHQATRPSLNHLPSVFLNWAMVHAPGTAVTGSSSLARGLLTEKARTSPIDFEGNLHQLRDKLLFTHHTMWTSIPGGWFNAAAMRTAYENPTSPFWGATEGTRWVDFFGPGGTLASVIDALFVMEGPVVIGYRMTTIAAYLKRV